MCVTARSRVNDEETPPSLPRGARIILKDFSDKEAVQFREKGLVSTHQKKNGTKAHPPILISNNNLYQE